MRKAIALGAMLVLAGCSSNQIGEVIGGLPGAPETTTASAEVQSVNTQAQTITVKTQAGQTASLRYDENTLVVYQNQNYPVTALERGDYVLLTLQETQGATYVTRVDVEQSVQERTGTNTGNTGSIRQLTGVVANINQTAGTFTMQSSTGNVTISLPYNPPQATLNYFRSLRNGDTVRLEAVPLTTTRLEIYRFL